MNQNMTKWKLPADIKRKWVEALRGHRYKKGIGTLYNPLTDCHCVLGVLCSVSGVDNKALEYLYHPSQLKRKLGDVTPSYLMDETNPWILHVDNNDGAFRIPWLNDEMKVGFREFADLIEKYVTTEEGTEQ